MTKLEEKLLELGYQIDSRGLLPPTTLWKKIHFDTEYYIEVIDGKMVGNWWVINTTLRNDLKVLSDFEVFKGE